MVKIEVLGTGCAKCPKSCFSHIHFWQDSMHRIQERRGCSNCHHYPSQAAQVYRLRDDRYGARDPHLEYCGLRRSEDGLELKRRRSGPGEHRVRAGAVSRASLQDQETQGCSAHLQLRQTGDHGRQITGGVRRRRADR